MSALPVKRDYDGRFFVEGYEDLKFSTEEDAESPAELALYYYVDRSAAEARQDQRYRRAAERAKA